MSREGRNGRAAGVVPGTCPGAGARLGYCYSAKSRRCVAGRGVNGPNQLVAPVLASGTARSLGLVLCPRSRAVFRDHSVFWNARILPGWLPDGQPVLYRNCRQLVPWSGASGLVVQRPCGLVPRSCWTGPHSWTYGPSGPVRRCGGCSPSVAESARLVSLPSLSPFSGWCGWGVSLPFSSEAEHDWERTVQSIFRADRETASYECCCVLPGILSRRHVHVR